MTNYKHKKGNRIIKMAYLMITEYIMKRNATAKFCWLDEGFENNKDRIHFTSEGHKCMLVGVGCPDENNDIPLIVETEWEGKKNQRVDVTLNMSKIHIDTLEKIACEVYNTLWNPEVDEDWEIIKDETIVGLLDQSL